MSASSSTTSRWGEMALAASLIIGGGAGPVMAAGAEAGAAGGRLVRLRSIALSASQPLVGLVQPALPVAQLLVLLVELLFKAALLGIARRQQAGQRVQWLGVGVAKHAGQQLLGAYQLGQLAQLAQHQRQLVWASGLAASPSRAASCVSSGGGMTRTRSA